MSINGMNIQMGFALKSPQPLDARDVVTSKTELDNFVTAGVAYVGMVVYVESNDEDKGLYLCESIDNDRGTWVPVGDGASGGSLGDQPGSKGLTYELSEDETYATCTGLDPDVCKENDIVIAATYEGKPVTSIGMEAFLNCSSLTSVIVPNSVISLNWGAFQGCSNLKSITLGDNITDLGAYTFDGCKSLKNIEIPNGVTSIPLGVFKDCTSLESITIPDGAIYIGATSFAWCESLKSIEIPSSVTSIDYSAFLGCSSLESTTIPDSVTTIYSGAFEECSSLIIYCEAAERPAGWDAEWNPS